MNNKTLIFWASVESVIVYVVICEAKKYISPSFFIFFVCFFELSSAKFLYSFHFRRKNSRDIKNNNSLKISSRISLHNLSFVGDGQKKINTTIPRHIEEREHENNENPLIYIFPVAGDVIKITFHKFSSSKPLLGIFSFDPISFLSWTQFEVHISRDHNQVYSNIILNMQNPSAKPHKALFEREKLSTIKENLQAQKLSNSFFVR